MEEFDNVDYGVSLVEEILTAASNLEMDSGCVIDYVGLSYDAYLRIKREVEDSLDRPIINSDIVDSLTMSYVIVSGLIGIDYKFLKEVGFVQ